MKTGTHISKHISVLYNYIFDHIFRLPPISKSEFKMDILSNLICKDNPVIIEIGCNDGYNTLFFFKIFKNPKIYCFEPDPRAIERFKVNIGHNPDIELFEIALSNQNGEIEFFQSDGYLNEECHKRMPHGWDLSGSIKSPKEHVKIHPWITFNKKILVKSNTLDDWANKNYNGIIDLIWMDVQGAEINVFNGGSETLKKTRFIFTEYSNRELYKGQSSLMKLMKFLKEFRIVKRFSSDVLLSNNKIEGPI